MAKHVATVGRKGRRNAAGVKKKLKKKAGVGRGNTFADAGSDIASVFENIQNNQIKLVKYRENNSERPEPLTYSIFDLWTKFNEGKLIVYGPSQRKCVANSSWMRQLLKHMVNSPTLLDPITLRREMRDGQEVLAVADGAQRLTCFFLFRSRLLSASVLTTQIAAKRSQRNIDRTRTDHGTEVMSVSDLEAEYAMQFYASGRYLFRGQFADGTEGKAEPDGHVFFTPLDVLGRVLDSAPENKYHRFWGVDLSKPFVDTEKAPQPVVDFYEEVRRCMLQTGHDDKNMLAFDVQDQHDKSSFMNQTAQNNFMSNKVTCNVTNWSRQATSLSNLTGSLQKFAFCQDEFPRLVGDYASEWLKTLELEFIGHAERWGITSEFDAAYGVLVRAFLVTQGSEFVPVRQDLIHWAHVINDLMENFMFQPPDLLAKIRFRTAINNLGMYDLKDASSNHIKVKTISRNDTKITPDEMVQLVAYLYFAIDPEKMPREYLESAEEYFIEDLATDNDRQYLPLVYALVKEKGSKEKRKAKIVAASQAVLSEDEWTQERIDQLEEDFRTSQSKEGARNLALAVFHLRGNFMLESDPASKAAMDEDEDEDDDGDEDEDMQAGEDAGEEAGDESEGESDMAEGSNPAPVGTRRSKREKKKPVYLDEDDDSE